MSNQHKRGALYIDKLYILISYKQIKSLYNIINKITSYNLLCYFILRYILFISYYHINCIPYNNITYILCIPHIHKIIDTSLCIIMYIPIYITKYILY